MIPINTIVVPQGAEYQAVCRGVKKAGASNIQIISIPIGTKNIKQTLTNYASELTYTQNILIMGLCGSLSKQYSVGDTVLYKSCENTSSQQVDLNSELTTTIQQKLSIDLVTGLTSDLVIHQATEKLQLGNSYSVNVVDMEGYSYIQAFQRRNINVAMLRVVSDDLAGDIPDLSKAIDEDGNLKTAKMAIAFLKQPLAAIRLIKGSLTGLKVLEQITHQLLNLRLL